MGWLGLRCLRVGTGKPGMLDEGLARERGEWVGWEGDRAPDMAGQCISLLLYVGIGRRLGALRSDTMPPCRLMRRGVYVTRALQQVGIFHSEVVCP